MYADLLADLAEDVAAGGPAAAVLTGHEDVSGDSALALRLMGGVHRLVLSGRAPELAVHFPSAGGSYVDRSSAFAALREVLREHTAFLRTQLDQPPQTNEVGRAAGLAGGLLHVAARHGLPVRLWEIGTSGGLNLRADHFRYGYRDGGRVDSWGDPGSPVLLDEAWLGTVPPTRARLEVVERRGCDLAPIDAATGEGRLRLLSYVWPDQPERIARLRAALEVAQWVPVRLVTASAADFLAELRVVRGAATVLWHSIMWQYLEAAERSRVETELSRLGESATAAAPFVHLSFEPRPEAPHEFAVSLRSWPGGVAEVLGIAPPHGVPVTWS